MTEQFSCQFDQIFLWHLAGPTLPHLGQIATSDILKCHLPTHDTVMFILSYGGRYIYITCQDVDKL